MIRTYLLDTLAILASSSQQAVQMIPISSQFPAGFAQKFQQFGKRYLPWMFNLNDGKWGRGDDASNSPTTAPAPAPSPATAPAPSPAPAPVPEQPQAPRGNQGGNSGGPNQGPPDLDELWKDFNRKLGNLFGGLGSNKPRGNEPDWNRHNPGRSNNNSGNNQGNQGGNMPNPDMKSAGIGLGVVATVAALIWLGTGFFIVQEGQQAVITRFGALNRTMEAGFNWRMPFPIERHETVPVTQLRSKEIGRNTAMNNSSLRDWSMLTQDENIVDVRFTVQYKLKSASDFLFQNRSPDDAVERAAESAIREVVGKGNMDTVLNKDRESIQRDVSKSIQAQLDRYKSGIVIQNVNIQNVQPPEAVQAAFDDALKAGQDRDRLKNEGQAYANDVVPRAKGTAARLKEEAEGHKAKVVAQAEGDAQRFKSVYAEYAKAPQVTRDRMYLDTMQQIYSGTTKIMIDSRQGGNMLYLPLDKIMQQSGVPTDNSVISPANTAGSATNSGASAMGSSGVPAQQIPTVDKTYSEKSSPRSSRDGRERENR